MRRTDIYLPGIVFIINTPSSAVHFYVMLRQKCAPCNVLRLLAFDKNSKIFKMSCLSETFPLKTGEAPLPQGSEHTFLLCAELNRIIATMVAVLRGSACWCPRIKEPSVNIAAGPQYQRAKR